MLFTSTIIYLTLDDDQYLRVSGRYGKKALRKGPTCIAERADLGALGRLNVWFPLAPFVDRSMVARGNEVLHSFDKLFPKIALGPPC